MHLLERESCNTDAPLLSREEMTNALALMIHRMDAIDSRCADGFPLYSPGISDEWVISPGGSWAGGFWSGWWWLRSRITGSAWDLRKASDICQRLSQKISVDSINRSLIFWHGASLGDIWFGNVAARELTKESIAAIAGSYDPEINCIPLGTGMGGGKAGNRRITIDTLAALIQLFNRSEHSVYHQISRCHADTLLTACRRDDGAFYPDACYSQGSFRTADHAGMWSRGQAWAMLGLSRAAAQWGEPYLTHTHSACEYWRHSRPKSLPPSRLSDPLGLCDPSSAVIASLAMLSLADLMPDGDQWRIHAHQQITAVIHSQYFSGVQGNSSHQKNKDRATPGIFWGCCYKTNHGKDELVESAWGSYFLMAALSILVDVIQPSHC